MQTKKRESTFDLPAADAEVAQRIKDIRVTQGVTQAQIAGHLGIVHQQYHKYEAGVLRFSAGMLMAIADFLDCPITDLIPARLHHGSPLDAMQRIDLLRMRLQSQLQDCESEQKLLAVLTLLGNEKPLHLVVDN